MILPDEKRPKDEHIPTLAKNGFKVYDTFKKRDHPSLSPYLPDGARDTDKFFITVGPKVLSLLYSDEPYHGKNDDEAYGIISDTYGDVLTTHYLAMAEAFNKEAQTFLNKNASTFPTHIFKKPHTARPLCETFTTRMDGITD